MCMRRCCCHLSSCVFPYFRMTFTLWPFGQVQSWRFAKACWLRATQRALPQNFWEKCVGTLLLGCSSPRCRSWFGCVWTWKIWMAVECWMAKIDNDYKPSNLGVIIRNTRNDSVMTLCSDNLIGGSFRHSQFGWPRMVSGEAEALCLAFATAQGKVYFSEASARRGRVFVGVCPSSFWGWWIVFLLKVIRFSIGCLQCGWRSVWPHWFSAVAKAILGFVGLSRLRPLFFGIAAVPGLNRLGNLHTFFVRFGNSKEVEKVARRSEPVSDLYKCVSLVTC